MTKKKAVEKVGTQDATASTEETASSSVITVASIAAAAKLVDEVIAAINPGNLAMTTTDRRRAVKIRKGGEKYISTLVEIATTYNITSPVHAVDAMASQLAQVQLLVPLLRRSQVLLKLIEDIDLRTNSDMWGTATYVYSVAKHLAKRDGNVALALAPVEEFFSNGPRDTTKAKKTGTQAISTTTSATPATIEAQPAATVPPATTHA